MKSLLTVSLIATTAFVSSSHSHHSFLSNHHHSHKKHRDHEEKEQIVRTKNFDNKSTSSVNNRPLIGVLAQPLTDDLKQNPLFYGKTSFIMASYIHYIEAAGGRAVPIFYNGNVTEELAKLDNLNGVFYCGGDTQDEYLAFGRLVYDRVKSLNDQGVYFPAWGTCLGMQYLSIYASSDNQTILDTYAFDSSDENYNLNFQVDPTTESRMFSPLGNESYIFQNKNITYNHHHDGVRPQKFLNDSGIQSIFKMTSISYDNKGQAFVASIEGIDYPFYGVQFHPEKSIGTWDPTTKILHDEESIFYNRYFADFFINECKKNTQSFNSYKNEQLAIIENYDLVVTTDYTGQAYAF